MNYANIASTDGFPALTILFYILWMFGISTWTAVTYSVMQARISPQKFLGLRHNLIVLNGFGFATLLFFLIPIVSTHHLGIPHFWIIFLYFDALVLALAIVKYGRTFKEFFQRVFKLTAQGLFLLIGISLTASLFHIFERAYLANNMTALIGVSFCIILPIVLSMIFIISSAGYKQLIPLKHCLFLYAISIALPLIFLIVEESLAQ